MPSQQSRNWMVTWNNPPFQGTDLEIERKLEDFFVGQLTSEDWSYCSWQLERGQSGTLHVQAYVQFAGNKRLASLRALWPGCHAEVRRGSHEQAVEYTSKEDTRIQGGVHHEHGEARNRPGRRRDLEVVRRLDFGGGRDFDFAPAV